LKINTLSLHDAVPISLERVLQQPVDDAHDVMVVGVEPAAPPEIHELLEAGRRSGGGAAGVRLGLLQRPADAVELAQVAPDLERRSEEHTSELQSREKL